MWTYYTKRIGPPKKKNRENIEVTNFPPIYNDSTSKPIKQDQRDKRQTVPTTERLQQLFFSNSLADHGPIERKIKVQKKTVGRKASQGKVNEETALAIKRHLKGLRHLAPETQTSHLVDNDVLSQLRHQTFNIKDQALNALLDLGGVHGSAAQVEQAAKFLQSLVALREEDGVGALALAEAAREEALGGRGEKMLASSWAAEGSTDSQTSLTEEATATRKVPAAASALNEGFQQRGQKIRTRRDSTKTQDVTHGLPKQRRFMVYICGGYRDTVPERQALRENVYPRLYLYCKQRGYDFKMVDLRLGISDPVTEHHDTVELHLETLQDCQKTATANFFIFAGQKHEVPTPPVQISRRAFESILAVVERDRKKRSRRRSQAYDELAFSSQSTMTHSDAGSSFARQPSPDRQATEGDHRPLAPQGSATMISNEATVSRTSLTDGEDEDGGGGLTRGWADFDRDLTLLQAWYKLDENHVPPVYCLLPVSTHHPDFLSRDAQRRRRGRKAWRTSCGQLWAVLRRSAPEALGDEEASRLLRTVLDCEVDQGLSALSPPEEFCHCYKRIIPDLLYNLRSEHAHTYIDLLKGQTEVNQTHNMAHQRLINNIHRKLRHTNIYERNVGWGKKGLSPKHNRSHLFYTDRLCSHFQRTVTSSLNRAMELSKAKEPFDVRRRAASREQQREEMMRHIRHAHALEKQHVFRQAVLEDIRAAVESGPRKPILLLGEAGWGKSTTLAKAALLMPQWIPGDVRVQLCFVGLTAESRNVRLVLRSMCVQLAQTYSCHTHISEPLALLASELHTLLGLASAERPAVIALDALDELSEEHEGDVSWLCSPLPPHVYVLLSATTNSTAARDLQKQAEMRVIHLPPLTPEEVTRGLELRLEADSRQLRPQQRQLLRQGCLACPSPLFLEAAYVETRRWSSFSAQESLVLPGDLAKLYEALLSRLEREHGENLVRRAGELLSLSRAGITEDELLVLLARDSGVRREVDALSSRRHMSASSSHSEDSLPRVPSVLWARLRRALGPHLMEVESDGTWVHRWSHTELGRVAVQRYLRSEDSRKIVHADFADYYRGSFGGRHRDVFQPLAWVLDEGERSGSSSGVKRYAFNLRKLHGLPYHLVHSGQIMPLMNECLFNYDFLLYKAWGLSVLHIEDDLRGAVIPEKELLDVDVLSQVLLMSRDVLQRDPCQLASQLTGRLAQIVTQDRPVAPGDPCKFSHLHTLLTQCQRSSLPSLVPSFTCLLPPGGLMYSHVAGHMSPVTAIAACQDGSQVLTCSQEGTLRLWDLNKGRVVHTLTLGDEDDDGSSSTLPAADTLTLCLEDTLVAVTRAHHLEVRELDSGDLLYSESESLDVPVVTCAADGQLLVVFFDGSQMVKVFDLTDSCKLLCCTSVTLESEPIHKDHSVLLSRHSVKDYVLFAYRSGREAAVFSARAGSVVATLKTQHPSAAIQAVEMTSQYLLIFCRYPYKDQGDIVHIELFCSATFEYQRSILGCGQDLVSQVAVTGGGSHALAFCPSPRSGLTDIIIWNLETEDHKHLARFPGLVVQGMCLDLRFCLGFCGGERFLRLWDLASRINDQTLTYNTHKTRSDGTVEVIPMATPCRYVLCRSTRQGTVRVWNIARPRWSGRAVRVEHGLFNSTDVALARDMKLYILTDRGTSQFTESPTPVYQTLLVYDLPKRSYVKRQTGLFIVPCPQCDYTMLKDQVLLGLSETRDHLILWDLDSGYIKGRIKSPHKESLLSSSPAGDGESQLIGTQDHNVFQLVMPWDRRRETQTAKRRRVEKEEQREQEEQRRLDQEKYNAIDQYLLSGDQQVVVCSYYAHHLHVFCMASQSHLQTLEDRSSLLGLHTAALTHTGSHLLLSNYSDAQHTAYLTLWDLAKGTVRKRLKNEPAICCVAMTNDASRVAFGVAGVNKLKVWDPFRRKHKAISGYGSLQFGVVNQLFLVEEGAKAVLLAGELSMWDLNAGTVLSVFTPDSTITCVSLLGDADNTALLGFSDHPTLVTVRLSSGHKGAAKATKTHRGQREEDLFGESSSSEEEGEEEGRGP